MANDARVGCGASSRSSHTHPSPIIIQLKIAALVLANGSTIPSLVDNFGWRGRSLLTGQRLQNLQQGKGFFVSLLGFLPSLSWEFTSARNYLDILHCATFGRRSGRDKGSTPAFDMNVGNRRNYAE